MVIGYCCLHYGSDYIYWAIKSVIAHVDRFYVLYSPVGSHGSRTTIPCPDSRDDLFRLATLAARDKLVWYESDQWTNEGQQRMAIMALAPDADAIVVVDADEIWPEETIRGLLRNGGDWLGTFEQRQQGGVREIRIPLIHYWRSFYRAINNDEAAPTRLIFPRRPAGSFLPNVPWLHHFGYAQRPAIVEYKQHVHGHRGEWRTDINWFKDRFMANAQTDCHPVNINYWTPVEVNPWQFLPEWMRFHPYAKKKVIE